MTTFLAILTGGGLAALGGVLSGWITNWLGEKRDQRKYQHERAMAIDGRRQERLERAYLELLSYLSYHAEWARAMRPFMGPVKKPDPLPPEDVRRVEALVDAYGSPKVRGLLDEWRDYVGHLADADVTIAMVERSPNPSKDLDDDAMNEHRRIPSYRQAIFDAAEAIREQVRRELAGEA
jgi:hypothetical protein